MKNTAFPPIGLIAHKSVLRGNPDGSVHEAASLMERNGVSSVVIESGEDQYIFTVEDLMDFVHGGGDTSGSLKSLLLRRLDCISEEKKSLAVLEYMERNALSHLGVVDTHGALTGIVTFTDILSAIDPSIMMEQKKISELVLRNELTMFAEDWVLEDIIHHFRKAEDAVIVIRNDEPAGIITTRDILKIIASGEDTGKPLSHYMASPVLTMGWDATVGEALHQLKQFRIKRVIVADENHQLVGMITQSQLIEYIYGPWIGALREHSLELHELLEMLDGKPHGIDPAIVPDALTGLPNRGLLHKKIGEEIERIRRYAAPPFSLVLIDIDNFRHINNKYGHQVGDEILKAMSGILGKSLRKIDMAARWGGDEFAILLISTPLKEVRKFSDRIRGAIERAAFAKGITLTVGIGISEYSTREDQFGFYQRADKALHQAKITGETAFEPDLG